MSFPPKWTLISQLSLLHFSLQIPPPAFASIVPPLLLSPHHFPIFSFLCFISGIKAFCNLFFTLYQTMSLPVTQGKTLPDAWDYKGRPAEWSKSGGWTSAAMILGLLSPSFISILILCFVLNYVILLVLA